MVWTKALLMASVVVYRVGMWGDWGHGDLGDDIRFDHEVAG